MEACVDPRHRAGAGKPRSCTSAQQENTGPQIGCRSVPGGSPGIRGAQSLSRLGEANFYLLEITSLGGHGDGSIS